MADKEFKETVIRMLNKLESRIEALREHLNKKFQQKSRKCNKEQIRDREYNNLNEEYIKRK